MSRKDPKIGRSKKILTGGSQTGIWTPITRKLPDIRILNPGLYSPTLSRTPNLLILKNKTFPIKDFMWTMIIYTPLLLRLNKWKFSILCSSREIPGNPFYLGIMIGSPLFSKPKFSNIMKICLMKYKMSKWINSTRRSIKETTIQTIKTLIICSIWIFLCFTLHLYSTTLTSNMDTLIPSIDFIELIYRFY